MRRYINYLVVLIIGLFLGWLIFGNNSSKDSLEHDIEGSVSYWTCSMDPQVKLPDPGSCPICGMDLIPAESMQSELSENQFKMTKNALALANIETMVIKEGSISGIGIVLSGSIKENENNNAVQTTHFAGRIEKLFIKTEGERVTSGQKIALVYSPELVSTQGELLTALDMKISQPELYRAVRNKLKLWKLSDGQIDQIENTGEIITDFPIYANYTGVVIRKSVEEGNHVMEGQELYTISNLNTVWAEFDAYEKQVSAIKLGNDINITLNADPGTSIDSKVTFIDPILNSKTRTVIVRTELNNNDGNLKPGMFVKGLISSKDTEISTDLALTIPKTAVLWTGKRSVVYIKIDADEPVFEMREVELGSESNQQVEVLSGIKQGDEIVVNGTFTVDAAAQLAGKKSMMNTVGENKSSGKHEGMNH
jgi:Cu(I)/Ag(I) efflux system membrane fusion protein